jgi:hypothetical protein
MHSNTSNFLNLLKYLLLAKHDLIEAYQVGGRKLVIVFKVGGR